MNDLLNGTTLDSEFCKALNTGTVVVSCGAKNAGKSCFMLAMLRASVEANAFEEYILVFPSLYVEQHDSYAWCLKQKRFTIYTGYHNSILEKLYNQNKELKKQKKTMVIIDDATTFASELRLATNENLIALVSQARHLKISLWILVHSLKNILSPCLRENTGWLIIYSVTNSKLLNDIWEEYCSIQCDYKTFVEWYKNITKEKYSSFMLKTSPPVAIDIHSGQWGMVQHFMKLNLNNKQLYNKDEQKTTPADVKDITKSRQRNNNETIINNGAKTDKIH